MTATLSPATTPEQALEYRDRLLTDMMRFGVLVQDPENRAPGRPEPQQANWLLTGIRESTLVLWRENIRGLASAGQHLFAERGTNPGLLNPPSQFWVYENDLTLTGTAEWGIPPWFYCGATLLTRTEDADVGVVGMQVLVPRRDDIPHEDFTRIQNIFTEKGVRAYHDETVREMVVPRLLGFSMRSTHGSGANTLQSQHTAMLEFMNLEMSEVPEVQLGRGHRRRMQREGRTPPKIRVVDLRKRPRKKSDGPKADVDWTCRWVVEGHWREQWFPSKGEHKPVFVMPYIKGPEGKPLREAAEKVFRVVR